MALKPLSILFLFTNAKILINTETWLLDQKNFERSENLGFYLYLRPCDSGFHGVCFHDTKACELPDWIMFRAIICCPDRHRKGLMVEFR